jgi:HemK-like putative methylase
MLHAIVEKSVLSPSLIYQQKVRKRTESLLEQHRNSGINYEVYFHGIHLKMQEGVFCAAYGDGSHLLAKHISVRPGERILDLGTGSGAMALLAAQQGADVIAVDISPLAVACAEGNAQINGLTHRIVVRQSNLFEHLQGEQFSCILFNPPFMKGTPSTPLEMALYDDEYCHLTQFFNEVSDHLLPRGRLLLVFSEAGDLAYLQKLIDRTDLSARVIETEIPEDSQLKLVIYELSKEEIENS